MYGNDTAFLLRTINFGNLQLLPSDKYHGHCCEASLHQQVMTLRPRLKLFYAQLEGTVPVDHHVSINGFWSSPRLRFATIVSRNRFALQMQKQRDIPRGMSSSSDQAMIATQYLQIWCNLPSML
jgi:hypothetical protein